MRRGDYFHAHTFQNPTNDAPPYWRDVGTIDTYYAANMELLERQPALDLHNSKWPTVTYQRQLPPSLFRNGKGSCNLENSIISGGCVVTNSEIRRSILFSEVNVSEGCMLDGVLALAGGKIGEKSLLRNVILDNRCIIPPGTVIGHDENMDKEKYHVTDGGIVIVNRQMMGQGLSYNPELYPNYQ